MSHAHRKENCGPSNSFKYPEQEDVRSVPLESILTLVDPRTRTCLYFVKNKVTAASKALQDAIQGYHWNNLQATIHPYVAYYINSGDSEVILFLSNFYFVYELYYMLTCYGCINGSLYVPFLIFSVFLKVYSLISVIQK